MLRWKGRAVGLPILRVPTLLGGLADDYGILSEFRLLVCLFVMVIAPSGDSDDKRGNGQGHEITCL